MLFLVQWKRTDKADLVTAAKAKEKIPQVGRRKRVRGKVET